MIVFSIPFILLDKNIEVIKTENEMLKKEIVSALDMKHFMYERLNKLDECIDDYDKQSDIYRFNTPARVHCLSLSFK